MMMPPRLRKFALTAHVGVSVGWLGAVLAYLPLAIAGLTSQDAQRVEAAYLSMELIGWFVIVPSGLAALLIGLVQSLGTEWGLFRYYWVIVKFGSTIGALTILLLHMPAVSRMSDAMAATSPPSADFGLPGMEFVIHVGCGLLVLLFVTALSVYKPWGCTPYGQRKQRERREASRSPPQCLTTIDHEWTARTSWRLYVVLGAIGLVLLFVVLHLTGGGLHHH